MSRAAPATRATASSSEPRAADGCGATSKTATSTAVMNSTRVWAAREARVRDALTASLLTESATNSRPVSAPVTAARAPPKPAHAAGYGRGGLLTNAVPDRQPRLQHQVQPANRRRLSGAADAGARQVLPVLDAGQGPWQLRVGVRADDQRQELRRG